MKASISALVLACVLAGPAAQAQTNVASYASGKPGTAAYEHLSFWVKDGRRSAIYYAYGADRKEVKLSYASKFQRNKKPGFKVLFPNGHALAVVPGGEVLQVAAAAGKAPKTFAWEHEGPVDGIGTFCAPCAADEKAAMRLVRAFYLK